MTNKKLIKKLQEDMEMIVCHDCNGKTQFIKNYSIKSAILYSPFFLLIINLAAARAPST